MITTEKWPNPKQVGKTLKHSCYHIVCDLCGKDHGRLGLAWSPRSKEGNWPWEVINVGEFNREKVICKTHKENEIKEHVW